MFPQATQYYNGQECIPVGCVPAARRPYAGVCFRGGVCLGGLPGPGVGVCLVCGGCLPGPGGLPGLGGSAWCGRGVCIPGRHPPPVNRILDTRL